MVRPLLALLLTLLTAAVVRPAAAADTPAVRIEFVGGDVSAADQAAMQAMVSREYDKVVHFLGVRHERPITIRVADWYRGEQVRVATAYAWRSLILIPTRVYRWGVMPTAHELTHIVTGNGADLLLTEGLAVYVHSRFGEQPAFPNFRSTLEAALVASIARIASDANGGSAPDTPALALSIAERALNAGRSIAMADVQSWLNDLDQHQRRRAAYLMAGSFVGFLVEEVLQGDTARLMRLYRTADYAGVTGESLARLEERWRARLSVGR